MDPQSEQATELEQLRELAERKRLQVLEERRHREAAEELVRARTEPHAFADLLGPVVERVAQRNPSYAERALEAIEAALTAPPGRRHPCSNCSRLQEQDPLLPIPEAESFVRDGRVYWAADCPACVDYTWSKRFTKAYAEARSKGDVTAMRALDAKRAKREAKGRKVYVA